MELKSSESSPQTCVISVRNVVRAVAISLLAFERNVLAQNRTCQQHYDLLVNSADTLEEMSTYLDDAASCANDSTPVRVSVNWTGHWMPAGLSSVRSYVVLEISGPSEDDEDLATPAVVDGNDTTTLFEVNEEGELHLSHITLRAGRGDGGGGVHLQGSNAIMHCDGCVFESCSSDSADSGGGAILAEADSHVSFDGINVFQNCSTSGTGGAIYLQEASADISGIFIIEGCRADESGGGLAAKTGQVVFNSNSNASFHQCGAGSSGSEDNKGGCVYMTDLSSVDVSPGAHLSLSSCTLEAVSGAKGGGVYFHESSLDVDQDADVSLFSNLVEGGGNGAGFFGQYSSIKLTGGATMHFEDNQALDGRGGGLYMDWDYSDGDGNTSRSCLSVEDTSRVSFLGNAASDFGGGAYLGVGCEVELGGEVIFEGNTGERGGGLYVSDSNVTLSGNSTFADNAATRWGGAVGIFCDDYQCGMVLDGRTRFGDNQANRSGGGVYMESAILDVNNRECEWEGNTALYDGGGLAVDDGLVRISGGLFRENRAMQRGGIIFATGESRLSWESGVSDHNEAPAGGAIYLSNSDIDLDGVELSGDNTPAGAVFFLADSEVHATNTSIIARSGSDQSGSFALQVDTMSSFTGFACRFAGWDWASPCVLSAGVLVLDSCDFSESGTDDLVQASPAAFIRNAVVGDENYQSASDNSSAVFADTAHACDTLPQDRSCVALGSINGESRDDEVCRDSDGGIGVVCAAYRTEDSNTLVSLTGSSALELEMFYAPSEAVYHPEQVTLELVLRQTADAYGLDSYSMESLAEGGVIWELRADDGTDEGRDPNDDGEFTFPGSADSFTWTAVPSSGLLGVSQELTITVTGPPRGRADASEPSNVYNGDVEASFMVVSRTVNSSSVSGAVSFSGAFYYCENGQYWDGEECQSCSEQLDSGEDGEDALNCSLPGTTLATLPLRAGYWRGNTSQTYVRSCPLEEACEGGTGEEAESEDSLYCKEGYQGIMCTVCAEGYRSTSGYQCTLCEDAWGHAAQGAFWAAVAMLPFVLCGVVIFLVGGTTALRQMMKKVKPSLTSCSCSSSGGTESFAGVPGEGVRERQDKEGANRLSTVKDSAKGFLARCLQAIPFQKLKILIVVWQILSEFSALSEVPYPSVYKRFLRWVQVFNFDISWPLSASCIVGNLGFHDRLMLSTLVPLIVVLFLTLVYIMALWQYKGVSRATIEARRGATVRYASAVLLVSFLVFSSVSTTIFSTFSCDLVEDRNGKYLRADYRVNCEDTTHKSFQVYASVMILVYPVGIPVMFALLLLRRRSKINPPISEKQKIPRRTRERSAERCYRGSPDSPPEFPVTLRRSRSSGNPTGIYPGKGEARGSPPPYDDSLATTRREEMEEDGAGLRRVSPISNSSTDTDDDRPTIGAGRGTPGYRNSGSRETETRVRGKVSEVCFGYGDGEVDSSPRDRDKVLQQRLKDPDLQPTRFLWEPYEPQNYYYETVECGRRCLLTGALVFVMPDTAVQLAGACVFAFVSLLAFELMRPHLSPTDSWLYRTGCVVIFFSNFLGLMAKADLSQEESDSQILYGYLLVVIHCGMVIAIMAQAYVSMQAMAEEREEYIQALIGEAKPTTALLASTSHETAGHRQDSTCSDHARAARVHPASGQRRLGRSISLEELEDGSSHRRAQQRPWASEAEQSAPSPAGASSSNADEMKSVLSSNSTSRIGALTIARLWRSGTEVDLPPYCSPSASSGRRRPASIAGSPPLSGKSSAVEGGLGDGTGAVVTRSWSRSDQDSARGSLSGSGAGSSGSSGSAGSAGSVVSPPLALQRMGRQRNLITNRLPGARDTSRSDDAPLGTPTLVSAAAVIGPRRAKAGSGEGTPTTVGVHDVSQGPRAGPRAESPRRGAGSAGSRRLRAKARARSRERTPRQEGAHHVRTRSSPSYFSRLEDDPALSPTRAAPRGLQVLTCVALRMKEVGVRDGSFKQGRVARRQASSKPDHWDSALHPDWTSTGTGAVL